MKTRTLLVFGVLCSVIIVVSAWGGKGGGMEKMKKCGDEEFKFEEAMKGMEECKAAQENSTQTSSRRRRSPQEDGEEKKKRKGKKKGKGKGRGKKDMCANVCLMKKQGLLDESGNFSESGAQEFVNKFYPEMYRTDAFNSLKACATENSSTFSMADNCSGYKKFKRCAFKAHMKVCGINKGKGKDKGGDKGGDKEGEKGGDNLQPADEEED